MTDTTVAASPAANLAAGSVILQRMTVDELRAELALTLTITSRHLVHLAEVWRELERRGEDLSSLRSGLWAYMPMIARGEVRAELVVRYAGYATLLRRVAQLSLADQDKLIADDRVAVVELSAEGFGERHVPLSRIKGPDLARVIQDRIVSPAEQREALISRRAAAPAPASRDPAVRAAAAVEARGRKRGDRVSLSTALRMTEDELRALTERAESVGLPVATFLVGALDAGGFLRPARRVGRPE